jgi:hypothetical protein
MADTTTTAYGLTKPEVGASEDTWGTKINTDLDSLDTIVNAIGGKTAAGTLSYADSAKLATTSTGVDVKNVASGANAKLNITTESTGGGTSEILFSDNTTGRGRIYYDHGSSPEELHIEITGTDALVIDNSQNITIPNGNVGIGTSSPTSAIDVRGEAVFGSGTDGVKLTYSGGNNTGIIDTGFTSTGLEFRTGNSFAAKIDSSGNFGIKVVPKATNTTVTGSLNVNRTGIIVRNSEQVYWSSNIYWDASDQMKSLGSGYGVATAFIPSDGSQRFYTTTASAGSADANLTLDESMRITSTGELLVGKATNSIATAGTAISSTLGVRAAVDGDIGLLVNRLTSDGDLIDLRQNSVSAGSIGTNGSTLYIGSTEGTDAYIGFGNNIVRPVTSAGASRDNAIDLGYTGMRFKDLYLSGGVYLGGTGAANLLDDYEEGTFEVTAAPNTSGTVTLNVSYNTLSYTKVGRVVTINGEVRASSVSSPVGTRLVLSNLPFSVADLDDYSGRANGCTYGYISSTVVPQTFRCPEGNTQIWLDVDCSTLGSGNEFGFSFSYFTT